MPSQQAGTRFTYPVRMEGWVDLGYPAMHRPGVELAVSRSQVRRPNHYATEPLAQFNTPEFKLMHYSMRKLVVISQFILQILRVWNFQTVCKWTSVDKQRWGYVRSCCTSANFMVAFVVFLKTFVTCDWIIRLFLLMLRVVVVVSVYLLVGIVVYSYFNGFSSFSIICFFLSAVGLLSFFHRA